MNSSQIFYHTYNCHTYNCYAYLNEHLNSVCISSDALISIVDIPLPWVCTMSSSHSRLLSSVILTHIGSIFTNFCLWPVVQSMRCVNVNLSITEPYSWYYRIKMGWLMWKLKDVSVNTVIAYAQIWQQRCPAYYSWKSYKAYISLCRIQLLCKNQYTLNAPQSVLLLLDTIML